MRSHLIGRLLPVAPYSPAWPCNLVARTRLSKRRLFSPAVQVSLSGPESNRMGDDDTRTQPPPHGITQWPDCPDRTHGPSALRSYGGMDQVRLPRRSSRN